MPVHSFDVITLQNHKKELFRCKNCLVKVFNLTSHFNGYFIFGCIKSFQVQIYLAFSDTKKNLWPDPTFMNQEFNLLWKTQNLKQLHKLKTTLFAFMYVTRYSRMNK